MRLYKAVFMAAVMAGFILIPMKSYASSPFVEQMADTIKAYPIEDKEIKVNLYTKTVEVNGESTSLHEVIPVSRLEEKSVLQTEAALTQALEDEGYEKESRSGNQLTYTSPYEARRLIVVGRQPEQTYGAVAVVEKPGCYTVYQYASIPDTYEAYQKLSDSQYDVYVDEVITEDALCGVAGADGHLDSGVELMGLDRMQENAYYQQNQVTVAVIDSGIKQSVIDEGRLVVSKDFSDDATETVTRIHGSRVGGIIVDATPDNVKLWSLKVINSNGNSSISAIDAAITYAYENGADVINMSIGADTTKSTKNITLLKQSIDTAIKRNIPVIAAAGNMQHSTDYCYPASYTPVWAISSINKEKSFSALFSNYGEIDFCGPGEIIHMIDGGSDYGTSFSTPYISAFAATLKGGTRFSSVDELYASVQGMCEDLGELGYDQYYGYGLPVYKETYDCTINGHAWSKGKTEEATCIVEKRQCFICQYCGETKTEVIGPALNHDYQVVSVTEATCCLPGSVIRSCARCGQTKEEATQKDLEHHVHIHTQKQEPTCTKSGLIQDICLDCGKTIKSEGIPRISHTYVAKRKDASATENGYVKRVCSVCGDEKVFVIPATGNTEDTTQEEKKEVQTEAVMDKDKETASSGRTGTYTLPSHQITLPSVKIKQLSNKKGGKLIVKTDQKKCPHQIQISASKKMKKAKTYTTSKQSYTIKKLKKKKTYYVRVRTYSRINGKRVYGFWSEIKKVKIKR